MRGGGDRMLAGWKKIPGRAGLSRGGGGSGSGKKRVALAKNRREKEEKMEIRRRKAEVAAQYASQFPLPSVL